MSGGGAAAPGSRFGRFEVRVDERRLYVDAQPVGLGSRAFDLLAALVARRDRVVPKDELIDVVWPGLVVEENNLQVQISALRKVLGAQAIATVPGRGYQFTVAATARASAAASTSSALAAAAVPVAAAAPAAAASRGVDRATAGRPHRCRLLVADDNKVNRLLLCRSLELMGHEVATADNGRSALQALRDGAFDLLLLDLEMPELDGFGLLEQRAADPALREVPVIVTSSLEGAAAVARCIELGADDYLHKPVNPVLLKARVDSSLERKHLRDRQRELLARLAPDLADGSAARKGGDDSGGRCVEATILVARLRGLEPLALAQPAQETLELLSDWATLMVDAVEGHGGLVNQITGAGLAAVFGAPEPLRGDGGAPWAAVRAALEMRELTAQFNAERTAQGQPPVEPGIGVASGEIVAGRAGTSRRAAYVCIGAAVQRAAGLEAMAEGVPAAALLIDEATRAALPGRIEATALPRPASAAAAAAYAVTRAA